MKDLEDMKQELERIKRAAGRYMREAWCLGATSAGLVTLSLANLMWGNGIYGPTVRLVISLVAIAVAAATLGLAYLGFGRGQRLRARVLEIREELQKLRR